MRHQLNNCDIRFGNCDRQLTSLRDQLSMSQNAHQLSATELVECNEKTELIDNELIDCKNETIEIGKQLTKSGEVVEITQELSDCERSLIRKDFSLELIKETNEKLTNENRKTIEERGSLRNQIEQLTKEVGQLTQKLHACVTDN